jgi:excisionase family DNA binding protein
MADELWDYQQVADYAKCSWRTIRKWANERKIPVVKVGNLNRFDPDEIKAHFAKKRP